MKTLYVSDLDPSLTTLTGMLRMMDSLVRLAERLGIERKRSDYGNHPK